MDVDVTVTVQTAKARRRWFIYTRVTVPYRPVGMIFGRRANTHRERDAHAASLFSSRARGHEHYLGCLVLSLGCRDVGPEPNLT